MFRFQKTIAVFWSSIHVVNPETVFRLPMLCSSMLAAQGMIATAPRAGTTGAMTLLATVTTAAAILVVTTSSAAGTVAEAMAGSSSAATRRRTQLVPRRRSTLTSLRTAPAPAPA
jgi:hypothetical protein